jgi:hypothetical protein
MGDNSPTYVLTVIRRMANPAFNPDSQGLQPFGAREYNDLERRRYHEEEVKVTLTEVQFEKLKKSLLENWQ